MITGQTRSQVAPELIEAFLNTRSLEDGFDILDAGWLRRHGLLRGRVDEDGLRRVRAVREALRELALANNGELAAAEAAGRVLDRQSRQSGLAVRFRPGAHLEPSARGVDGALGRVLATVAASMADGTWSRFKACRAETCRWVFYDRARNRSRHWCSMAVCGNRSKARAFRARRAQ